jgi:DNA-binding NtrC family response regulator
MFLEVLKNNGEMTGDILKGHETLFQGLEGESIPASYGNSFQAPEMNPNRILPPSTPNFDQPSYQNVNVSPSDNELKIISLDDNNTANDVYDITHVAEEVSLSLEKQEKDMIIRALRKNKNKRKYAAQDLGISERTLYRKIKQYDIEEE